MVTPQEVEMKLKTAILSNNPETWQTALVEMAFYAEQLDQDKVVLHVHFWNVGRMQ